MIVEAQELFKFVKSVLSKTVHARTENGVQIHIQKRVFKIYSEIQIQITVEQCNWCDYRWRQQYKSAAIESFNEWISITDSTSVGVESESYSLRNASPISKVRDKNWRWILIRRIQRFILPGKRW